MRKYLAIAAFAVTAITAAAQPQVGIAKIVPTDEQLGADWGSICRQDTVYSVPFHAAPDGACFRQGRFLL